VQARAIRIVSNRERTAYPFMPAAEKFSRKTNLNAKCFVLLINERLSYFVPFKNRLHFSFFLTLSCNARRPNFLDASREEFCSLFAVSVKISGRDSGEN